MLKSSSNGNDVWKTADGTTLGFLQHKDSFESDVAAPVLLPEYHDVVFYCTSRGANAVGYLGDDGMFIVEKGSYLSPMDINTSCPENARKRLSNEATSIENNQLLTDLQFSSPSAAAAFVMKISANGIREWVNPDGIELGEFR